MSLIIKITQNGVSQEYLFNKLGPIIIGSDPRSDLHLEDDHIGGKLLEVKVSGGNIFIKEIGSKAEIYLDSVILPFREEVRYREGDVISIKNTSYQMAIYKVARNEAVEPPPFFDGEFKERLDNYNLKIREKEKELKALGEKEEKRKQQVQEVESRYYHHANEKGRLEVEVTTLKAQKETLLGEIKKTIEKGHDTEDKILHLKDFVKKLETEERLLKDTITAQTLVLTNLKEERNKKNSDVENQRQLLAGIELERIKAQEDLSLIKAEFSDHEKEIETESHKIQSILNSSEVARKESIKIQGQIAHSMKEKSLLDHEVTDLQERVSQLETERKNAQGNLLKIRSEIDHAEHDSRNLKDQILRQHEEENNLKLMNNEVRAELARIEEKLSLKKNQINQIDYQEQEISRKIATVNFELERSSHRLTELVSEEKTQELKVLSLREDYQHFLKKIGEDKKSFTKDLDAEKQRQQMELDNLRDEIVGEKKNLAQVESQKNLTEVQLDEVLKKQRELNKDKLSLENNLSNFQAERNHLEAQIKHLKDESNRFQHEKDHAQRDLNSLKIKLAGCEEEIKSSMEEARVEMENFRREERARIVAEKEVYLAEVEAFRQKSLVEVENEYRRKEEDLHQLKSQALKESDEIIMIARQTELAITEEATKRLREATIDSQKREIDSHERVKEAQSYFKGKEREADQIIEKSRAAARELISATEKEINDEIYTKKEKLKEFLAAKQASGLGHIKELTENHLVRLQKFESRAQDKLEEIKRKELKKIVKLRDDELDRQNEAREMMLSDLQIEKEKALEEIARFRTDQESEISSKKKSMLEHINQNKFSIQKTWEAEMKREKEEFYNTKKERILNATAAVMNVFIAEHGPQGEKEAQLRNKIKMNLEMAIDGQNAHAMNEVDQILDFNPMKRKKVLPVLKKYSLRFGVPALVASLILADVGGVRSNSVNLVKEFIQNQNSASEIYVNQQKTEWKEKHTYNPEKTTGYKDTYVNNVIYTIDFDQVVDSEEFQNDWILKVHDFMVKDLELSEDLAISFISSEGTLIKELVVARKDLHPQFLETGLKKMQDLETTHLGWLNDKIPDVEKKTKFDTFRKEYYDQFYANKFQAHRGLATEEKN